MQEKWWKTLCYSWSATFTQDSNTWSNSLHHNRDQFHWSTLCLSGKNRKQNVHMPTYLPVPQVVSCDWLNSGDLSFGIIRFTSQRSVPNIFGSDNASTYLAAADKLQWLLQSNHSTEALVRSGVLWHFIPKHAPWYGGWWEHLIDLTKMSLKKVLGRSRVTLPDLQTLVVEVEAIINDRPMTHVSPNFNDAEPLTPVHLLHCHWIVSLPHEKWQKKTRMFWPLVIDSTDVKLAIELDYKHSFLTSFIHVGNMSTSPHSDNIIRQLVSIVSRLRKAI